MLTIEIKINGRLIAGAKARNVSGLADLSDYRVEVVEEESEVTGLPDFHADFTLPRHARKQSVWALVQNIATAALLRRAAASPTRAEPGEEATG